MVYAASVELVKSWAANRRAQKDARQKQQDKRPEAEDITPKGPPKQLSSGAKDATQKRSFSTAAQHVSLTQPAGRLARRLLRGGAG